VSQIPGHRLAPTQNDPIDSAPSIVRQIDSIAQGLARGYFSQYPPKQKFSMFCRWLCFRPWELRPYFSISKNNILRRRRQADLSRHLRHVDSQQRCQCQVNAMKLTSIEEEVAMSGMMKPGTHTSFRAHGESESHGRTILAASTW
jgi:hypothetical protein